MVRLQTRPLAPDLLHLLKRGAQVAKPAVLVLTDQAHAPRQRIASAPGYAGIDEGVKYEPLGLPEPGHHRHRERGEHHLPPGAVHAPRDLAAERVLGFPGNLDAAIPRLLAEAAAEAVCGRPRPPPPRVGRR